jgi:transposase
VEQNGLPISIVISPANIHDSTKFVDVVENISDYLDDSMMDEIVTVCADKGYDAKYIRNYLRNNDISCCIPYRNNSKFIVPNDSCKHYNKTRFVVERFFGWLKNGFHRTRIRYEKNCDNYFGFVYLASIVMYWRVLG